MKTEVRNVCQGWYEMHFDSPLDMLELRPSPNNEALSRQHMEMGGGGWSKCKGREEFNAILRGGAREFVASTLRKMDTLTVEKPVVESLINVIKRQRCVADSGDELDFAAWRRNDLDRAWSTTRRVVRETKRNRAACLFVNLTVSGDVHADSLEWRSAAFAKIVQTLTAASWATEVVVGSTTRETFADSSDRLGISFTAKPSIMPLSLERLVLQTSAAWLRYCVFEAMTSNDAGLRVDNDYGYPLYSTIPPYVARMFGRGYKIIQIPGSSLSQGGAQDAINSTLREVQS
jgi:hypothetical protein